MVMQLIDSSWIREDPPVSGTSQRWYTSRPFRVLANAVPMSASTADVTQEISISRRMYARIKISGAHRA
jgi:hypothetical protein